MANTVILEIEACEPTPDQGYQVLYRPQGDLGAYRVWPYLFTAEPDANGLIVISFTDENDPDGTEYEGFVRGVCDDGTGINIPWDSGEGSGASEGGGGGGESPGGCDGGEGDVFIVNNTTGRTVTDVTGIAGFSAFPPSLLPGNTRHGTHTAFTGSITFTVSGSGSTTQNAVLFQNETLVDCVEINSAGLYAFPSINYAACDTILLILTEGNCM